MTNDQKMENIRDIGDAYRAKDKYQLACLRVLGEKMADSTDPGPVDASTEKLFDFVEFDIEVEKLVSALRDAIDSGFDSDEVKRLTEALAAFDAYKEEKK
jgi:hypothetical protein